MKKNNFNYHPIQLRDVRVLSLFIKDNPHYDVEAGSKEDYSNFSFFHTHSEFDSERKAFAVKVRATIGVNEEPELCEEQEHCYPFKLDVELVGMFEVVDTDSFDENDIPSFAKQNAPLILYPYLREHVYSLTTRAGYESAVLPLFEVSPFKIQR